jgi:hypothetical protein
MVPLCLNFFIRSSAIVDRRLSLLEVIKGYWGGFRGD